MSDKTNKMTSLQLSDQYSTANLPFTFIVGVISAMAVSGRRMTAWMATCNDLKLVGLCLSVQKSLLQFIYFSTSTPSLCYWLPGQQHKPEECPTLTSLMKLLLHCSWPGQVEWWCEALQLHSKELLCQFKGGAEADKCSFLPPLPPCPALWRKLWLWDSKLEILHLCVRENSEEIPWGIFILSLLLLLVSVASMDSEIFSQSCECCLLIERSVGRIYV